MDFRTGVMIDIETLGVAFDSVIVTIAAAKFSISKGILSEFSVNIDPIDAKKYGLKTDKKTIDWWKDQPKEAVDAWRKDARPLVEAVNMFCDWYGEKSHPTWAKGGPCFDFPILETTIHAAGCRTPYHYRDCMDYRTIMTAFDIKDWKRVKNENSHVALDDCRHQINVILPILEVLQSWKQTKGEDNA